MTGALAELSGASDELCRTRVLSSAEPVVLRGLVDTWPAVKAAGRGTAALVGYLKGLASAEPMNCVIAPPEANGRMHYDATLRGFNFKRVNVTLNDFLDRLVELQGSSDPPSIAAQGVLADRSAPGFAKENALDWLPASADQRLWIGNRLAVAIHCDPADNLACVVTGRRRFTLFAPHLLPDLAMGPFDPTPAGTPISMADPRQPDFERFPQFRNAMENALVADLGPGDAIFIPYHWYHHVESLDPVSMLVNHWWNDEPVDGGSPWDAMMHGIMALRHLPPNQRQAWQAMFAYYVFLAHGDPAAHLPPDAAGILTANTRSDRAAMRRSLLNSLGRLT